MFFVKNLQRTIRIVSSINVSLHHSFDIKLASVYGVLEAILIHHFQHWISINEKLKRNFRDGRTWTYQTLDEIAAHFPYLSRSQVSDIIEKLCTGKQRKSKKTELDFEPVLIKGNFNTSSYDRTTWYALCPKCILGNPNMGCGKSQNQLREIPTPIPDTKTDTKQEKKEDSKESKKDSAEASPSSKPKKKISNKTKTCPEDQRSSLIQDYGKDSADKCIQLMEDYVAAHGEPGYSDWTRVAWAKEKLGLVKLKKEQTTETPQEREERKRKKYEAMGFKYGSV